MGLFKFSIGDATALAARHLPRVAFEVVAALIAEVAKRLCTVTNTILGSPTVAASGRAMR